MTTQDTDITQDEVTAPAEETAAPAEAAPQAEAPEEAVAEAPADQRSTALAKGIGIAMNTTGFGLMVAIPLLASHIFISNLAKKITDEVELYSVKLENLLAARVRQG